jgi:hypothetical protein
MFGSVAIMARLEKPIRVASHALALHASSKFASKLFLARIYSGDNLGFLYVIFKLTSYAGF